MSTWKLTKKLKETHLSSAFSPRSSASSSTTTTESSSPNGKSSSASSSQADLTSTNRTPLSFVNVTTGHSSPGRKIPNSSASSLETISGNSNVGGISSSPGNGGISSVSSSSSVRDSGTITSGSVGSTGSTGGTSVTGSSSATNSLDSLILPKDHPSTSTITPGLLSVTLTKAIGLSLPPGNSWPNYILRATSLSPTKDSPNINLLQLQKDKQGRKRPPPIYIVLEYDKTQVILDSIAGTVDSPIFEKVSNFDVSRVECLSIQVFAKIPVALDGTGGSVSGSIGGSVVIDGDIESPFTPTKQMLSQGNNIHSESLRKKGYQEIFLGTCKINTDLSRSSIYDGWLPLSSGTGKIHIKIDFKPNKNNKHLTIEDFDLLKVVGKGSFGKVMQVRKIDTRRIYALKTIRKAHIISRSEVNHTLAERTVLAQIDNPFIVPLKFSFQSPEKLYLVLAFINGGELFHHLQREGRFDLNRSRFYTAELLCALECLHEYNVIYRDLKPENILLDYTGHIALCDFGLCKLNMKGQEKTNTFCGTPEYLSPELLLGQGYTKVVDWWTLGVLFYEMLTGLPPFYDQDTNEMYRKILQDPLRFPDDMDRDAKDLLIGLLNRDPKRRLGVNGAGEIKSHPFFAQIDWKRLMNKKYAAPFKPSVESATDTSNFDQEFTSEVPTDSVVEKDFYLSESVQQQFGGWTYTNTDSKLATSGRW